MCTRISSPGLNSRVWEFGVWVARSLSCGLGGPAGAPLVWMKPKLTGSVQFGLHGPEPFPVHSRLSIVRAEHQWVSSQLMPSTKGPKPGGENCSSTKAAPPPGELPVGALASHSGAQGSSGAEVG